MGYLFVQDFLHEYGLSVCDNLNCNRLGYSYRHEGLNCQSLIDHVFVSPGLVNNVHNHALLYTGLNFSDHCAVCLMVKAKFLIEIAVASVLLLPCLFMYRMSIILPIIKTLLLKIYILYKVVLMILIVVFHVITASIRLHCLHFVIIWLHA